MSRHPPRFKYPDNAGKLVAEIERSRTLTRGQLAQAAALMQIEHAINLADPDDPRRELSARKAESRPVLRTDMSAFSGRALPEAEVVIYTDGVPPHRVRLLHEDRHAYAEHRQGEEFSEPDWSDVSAEHPSCDHAAWLLAILKLRYGLPDKTL